MPLTQYGRDQLLTYGFTATALTRPTAWYAAAFTGFPGDTGTSIANELTSASDPGYSRQSVSLALTSHIIQNSASLTYTATGTWTAATFLGIADASTAGNLWAYMELSQSGASYFLAAAQFANPGSGYAASDTVTLTGGGGAVLTVDAVATVNGVAGVIQSAHISTHGSIAAIPANPLATTTSGSGTGATVLGSWLLAPQAFQLNNGDSLTIAADVLQIAAG